MKILALETTEKFGSVALLNDHHVLSEIVLPKDRRSSQTLHPAIHALFETTRMVPTDIDIVAVVTGPGSFTGLRVGVTAAKVFAYSTGAKVIAQGTFETVASGSTVAGSLISIGVDAQRGEVVAAILRRTESGGVEMVREPELIPVADWWKHAEWYTDVLFTGPALERWSAKAPPHIPLAPDSDWFPKASAAGKLAAERMAQQQFDDAWALLPIYSRMSAAEERSSFL
jgi:tRNA threonylcarbamoyladenosine biosynthesis protein TsaB